MGRISQWISSFHGYQGCKVCDKWGHTKKVCILAKQNKEESGAQDQVPKINPGESPNMEAGETHQLEDGEIVGSQAFEKSPSGENLGKDSSNQIQSGLGNNEVEEVSKNNETEGREKEDRDSGSWLNVYPSKTGRSPSRSERQESVNMV